MPHLDYEDRLRARGNMLRESESPMEDGNLRDPAVNATYIYGEDEPVAYSYDGSYDSDRIITEVSKKARWQ